VVLDRAVPLTQAVIRLPAPSLWILPAGTPPENPSELLSSPAMEALIAQLRTGPFDWVVVDTPPVLAVTDSSILARHATGVVFVLGAAMTRRRAAERAIDTLALAGPRILGAIINRVSYTPDAYYSYEQYHQRPQTAG